MKERGGPSGARVRCKGLQDKGCLFQEEEDREPGVKEEEEGQGVHALTALLER